MIALIAAAILALTPIDWDRDFTPVTVDGFTLESCEGDGPFVCVTDADDGRDLGFVEHLTFPAEDIETVRDLRTHIEGFYADIAADRAEGCGPGYRVRPRPVFNRRVAGERGLSYGFEGIRADGVVVERTYGVMALRGGTVHIVSAGAYDDGGCLSNEGEFSVADLKRFEPVLRGLAAVTPLR